MINSSDLPEVPTQPHSQNESKANKRTRNQVIKEQHREQRVEKLMPNGGVKNKRDLPGEQLRERQ